MIKKYSELSKKEVKSIRTFDKRPEDIPESWLIFVAPRPIFGEKEWRGSGGHGWHYAAVDPSDEYMFNIHIKGIQKNDARLIQYCSEKDFMSWLEKEMSQEELKEVLSEKMVLESMKDNYIREGEDKVVAL